MERPTDKKINRAHVTVDEGGLTHWTRISFDGAMLSLGHEEARDLLYAMQRIVAYLDSKGG